MNYAQNSFLYLLLHTTKNNKKAEFNIYYKKMFKKLAKTLIVFCGGSGSGKSTCGNLFADFFNKNGLSSHYINSRIDLYIPFAKKKGFPLSLNTKRKEVMSAIKSIQKTYGENIGSKLLIKLINEKRNKHIFILDGKRNSKGIQYLKENFTGKCYIFFVLSKDNIRLKRIIKRAKNIDSEKEKFKENIKQEELTYSISKSMLVSNLLILNDKENISHLRKKVTMIASSIINNETKEDASLIKTLWNELLLIYGNKFFQKKTLNYINDFHWAIKTVTLNSFNKTLLNILSNDILNGTKNIIKSSNRFFILNYLFRNKSSFEEMLCFFKKYQKTLLTKDFVEKEITNFKSIINECEAKFLLPDKNLKLNTILKKRANCIKHIGVEDDLVVDTKSSLLKSLGIILRFRFSQNKKSPIFTIKFKRLRGIIKKDIEIEKTLSKNNIKFLEPVNEFLSALGLQKIPFTKISYFNDNDKLSLFLKKAGYSKTRMRIQKERSELKINNLGNLCIDRLPQKIGNFIEIESTSEDKLEKLIDFLGLNLEKRISKDYGKIVIEHNKRAGIKNYRVAKFNF